MRNQIVRLTLQVTGTTDRDPWQWGEGLARCLEGELHENSENSDAKVECVDVEKPVLAPGLPQ